MAIIRIMFSRYSAFYSPLVAAKAAGLLQAEGLEPEFSVATPHRPARRCLLGGEVDLIQSAVSASWAPLERGERSDVVHFAPINQRDGFFLVGRSSEPDFAWAKLAGRSVLADHGGQPLAMFKYALHRQGVDSGALTTIDAGGPDQMEAAFRAGEGDYVHLQGPAPQQLAHDGVGRVVASVGEAIGPVAFSSLCTTRSWLATDTARRFMRAYAKARAWVAEAPADEVAAVEAPFFPGIDREALRAAIAAYQRLGTWLPPLAITREAYEAALEVFEHGRLISRRHPYEAVVVPPPEF